MQFTKSTIALQALLLAVLVAGTQAQCKLLNSLSS